MQGAPGDTGSLLSKRYFMGWATTADFATNPDAKLYFSNQKVSDAFPDGSAEPQTLYSFYVSYWVLSGIDKTARIELDRLMTAQQMLPDARIAAVSGFDGSGPSEEPKSATLVYDPKEEHYRAIFNANFELHKAVALLIYHNPGGILTNSGQWHQPPAFGNSYTHIDLHIRFDDRLTLADELKNISFTSYNFKPEKILDDNYELIVDSLSKHWIKDNPTTTFNIPLNGRRAFILRTTIRRDGNPNYSISATPEDVMRDMVLSSGDDNNFSFGKDVAAALADGAEPLQIGGYVDGVARMAGRNISIKKLHAPSIHIYATHLSVSFDRNHPGAAADIAPVLVEYGRSIAGDDLADQSMPDDPSRSDEGQTRYRYMGWNSAADGDGAGQGVCKA